MLLRYLKKTSLSAEHFKNYHPVSGLSFISKLIERVVLKRLICHLSESNLLASVQSAYRASHSTETALLRVLNDLLLYVNSGDVLALLDLSVVFDTVDHSILLSRLESNFGLTGKALSWLRSYLTGRRQKCGLMALLLTRLLLCMASRKDPCSAQYFSSSIPLRSLVL